MLVIKDNQEIISNDTLVESYGASWSDFDNDGDLDLFVPNAFGAPNNFLYLNIFSNDGNSNNWFKATLKGVTSNSSAIGARIYIKANINGNDIWQMREINANSAHGGGGGGGVSGLVTHFGLGDATIIDSLKVVWPASGITQIFTNVIPNRHIEISEDDNTIYDNQKCIADNPLKNPAIIRGKIYHDVDDDCIFDQSIDVPIANRLISLGRGNYHVLTNDSGQFEFRLPQDVYSFNAKSLENDIWKFQCPDSIFNFDLISADTIENINIPLKNITASLCGVLVNLDIIPSPPIGVPSPCFPLPLTSPCPGYQYGYCVVFENDPSSSFPIDPFTNFQIVLDNDMIITSITTTPIAIIAGIGTNTLNGAVIGTINPGSYFEVCFTVDVLGSASAPFQTTATFNIGGAAPPMELIINGDFQQGNVGFGTDYSFNQPCAPNTYFVGANPDEFNQNPNGVCDNDFHFGWDHTFGNDLGRYLYADGANNTNNVVWRQTIAGLTTGSVYNFSFWANNITETQYSQNDPNLRVWIDNTAVLTTTPISENPDIWLTYNTNWTAPNNNPVDIEIRSLSNQSTGNDFGIDDISFVGICDGVITDIEIELDTCSCDPNDKLVSPEGCGPDGNIDINTSSLEYLIRFENTGAGSAHSIVIRDVLDEHFDINSFEILGSSHPISQVEVFPNNVIFFTFNGIELPACTANPDECNGFVKFRIKPLSPVVEGTQVTNNGEIFFDSNPPVITNITTNTFRNQPYPDPSFTFERSCTDSKSFDFFYIGQTPDSASFYWDFGNDAIPSSSNDQNPQNIIFGNTGTHLVSLNISRFGCNEIASDTVTVSDFSCGKNKVLICHIPPGNPNNPTTICISENALPAHLAHGDCLGPCEGSLKNMESNPIDYIYNNETQTIFIDSKDEKVSLEVYDQIGRCLNKYSIDATTTKEIDLGDLPPAIYYGIIKSKNNQTSIKIVIY